MTSDKAEALERNAICPIPCQAEKIGIDRRGVEPVAVFKKTAYFWFPLSFDSQRECRLRTRLQPSILAIHRHRNGSRSAHFINGPVARCRAVPGRFAIFGVLTRGNLRNTAYKEGRILGRDSVVVAGRAPKHRQPLSPIFAWTSVPGEGIPSPALI